MEGSVEETPLAHACGRGDLEMAKLLVAHGADINRLCAVSSYMLLVIVIGWCYRAQFLLLGLLSSAGSLLWLNI